MAQANVGIQVAGKRVDLSGDIPDSVALEMIRQVTELLIAPTGVGPAESSPPPDAP